MERRNTSQSLAGHTAPLCLANGVGGKSRLAPALFWPAFGVLYLSYPCLKIHGLPLLRCALAQERCSCTSALLALWTHCLPLAHCLSSHHIAPGGGTAWRDRSLLQDLHTQTLRCPVSAFHLVGFASNFSREQHRNLHYWVLAPG